MHLWGGENEPVVWTGPSSHYKATVVMNLYLPLLG